jgi:hypothetical protein
MKCPCGEKVPFSRRRVLKQALELDAALRYAAEGEDLMNDMSGSPGASRRLARDMGLDMGVDPLFSEEEVEEAVFADRSDTWKLSRAVLEQLHEVAHGRTGTMPSENDLLALKLNLMAGPGGPHFLTDDDLRRLQDQLRGPKPPLLEAEE